MANTNTPEAAEHLGFIQAVIARLAGASALVKAWCLTVATATLGYAWTQNADEVAWLAIFAVAMFALVDVQYLREERKYRTLYREARLGQVDPFDMDARPCGDRRDARYDMDCGWWPTVRSWSVWAFYGPILILAVVVWATNSTVSDDHSENSLRISSHAVSFAVSE
jgi:histidine triad (HIT) family protein